MSIYGTSINCEGVPKTQNGQTKIKFRAQDLHTMTATVRTQTRDVTSFWYWQYTHRRRTVNGLSEIDKIRILTIKAWRKHGTVYPMNMKAASSPKRRYIYLPCSLGLDSTELPNFNISQFIKFYFISSVLNMFRTLIHPSSGACDFSIVSPHWLCVLVSMCVGVSVWLVGVVSVVQRYHPNQPHRNSNTHRNKNNDQCGDTLEKLQAPDDGCINVWNMLSK